jgi:esterase/lipase superfamily enzyme
MQVTYHKEYSNKLGREIEYKVYGHKGKPVLVFPTSNGRFFQYEDSGMVDVLRGFINDGKIQLWAIDSIDMETYFSADWDKNKSIARHEEYFNYINDELVPSILSKSKENNDGHDQRLAVTGCSMGAFHAANFYFRYPWFIDTVIALSGVYSTDYFFGDYKPEEIYLNSPVDYLQNHHEINYLDKYRNSRLIFCCGKGDYEDMMLADTYKLEEVLKGKGIPAWFDFWGHDSAHDWVWWQKQIIYYFGKIV